MRNEGALEFQFVGLEISPALGSRLPSAMHEYEQCQSSPLNRLRTVRTVWQNLCSARWALSQQQQGLDEGKESYEEFQLKIKDVDAQYEEWMADCRDKRHTVEELIGKEKQLRKQYDVDQDERDDHETECEFLKFLRNYLKMDLEIRRPTAMILICERDNLESKLYMLQNVYIPELENRQQQHQREVRQYEKELEWHLAKLVAGY